MDADRDDNDTRVSHDPSRHPGMASTATPARGHDAAVPEDPAGSAGITRGGALMWIVFPILCAVVLIVVLLLVFT